MEEGIKISLLLEIRLNQSAHQSIQGRKTSKIPGTVGATTLVLTEYALYQLRVCTSVKGRHTTRSKYAAHGIVSPHLHHNSKQITKAAADSFLLKNFLSSVLRIVYTCELRKPPLNCPRAAQSKFSQPEELLKSKIKNRCCTAHLFAKVLSRFVSLRCNMEQKCPEICHSVVIPRNAWLIFFIGWSGNQTLRERPVRKWSWSKPAWSMSGKISPLGGWFRWFWRRSSSFSWR